MGYILQYNVTCAKCHWGDVTLQASTITDNTSTHSTMSCLQWGLWKKQSEGILWSSLTLIPQYRMAYAFAIIRDMIKRPFSASLGDMWVHSYRLWLLAEPLPPHVHVQLSLLPTSDCVKMHVFIMNHMPLCPPWYHSVDVEQWMSNESFSDYASGIWGWSVMVWIETEQPVLAISGDMNA